MHLADDLVFGQGGGVAVPYKLIEERAAFGDLSIGIGRGLAAPSLPHHRAYGSVHGGSMDISGSVLGLTTPVRVERRARSEAHSRVRAIN